MRIIDVWAQPPTARLVGHEMFGSLRQWKTLDADAATGDPVKALLEVMDARGVERALICAWYGPDGPIISNDEVHRAVAAAPDRLVGVASVDLRDPMAAVRELRHAVEVQGMRALRIVPWLWSLPPNDRHYYPLYAACIDLGIPFCTQVGHTGPLRGSETGRPIPYLDEVALDFPELLIVGGHIGYPWTAEMISLATKYPNVYIDTSAYTVRRYPPELVAYLAAHGRRKVLFGSNYPMLTPARALADVAELGLDQETAELFLGGNAARVFGLGAG